MSRHGSGKSGSGTNSAVASPKAGHRRAHKTSSDASSCGGGDDDGQGSSNGLPAGGVAPSAEKEISPELQEFMKDIPCPGDDADADQAKAFSPKTIRKEAKSRGKEHC